jgi:hypothetical protein
MKISRGLWCVKEVVLRFLGLRIAGGERRYADALGKRLMIVLTDPVSGGG